jgi:hypothetical protein
MAHSDFSIVYVSGRPFVLRDSSMPRTALRLSDRAENLEAIEHRLKLDILAEAAKYGGLLLTHNEAAVAGIADGDAAILPTWTAVDVSNVKTSRELWDGLRDAGWSVEVSYLLRPIIHGCLRWSSITGYLSHPIAPWNHHISTPTFQY